MVSFRLWNNTMAKFISEYDDEDVLKEIIKRKLFKVVENKIIIPKKVYEEEIEVIKIPKKIYEDHLGNRSDDPDNFEYDERLRYKQGRELDKMYQENKYWREKCYRLEQKLQGVLPYDEPIRYHPEVKNPEILTASMIVGEDMQLRMDKNDLLSTVYQNLGTIIASELARNPQIMEVKDTKNYDAATYSTQYIARVKVVPW